MVFHPWSIALGKCSEVIGAYPKSNTGDKVSQTQRIPICVALTPCKILLTPDSILKSFTAMLLVSDSTILVNPNHDIKPCMISTIPNAINSNGIKIVFTEHLKKIRTEP